MAETFTPISLTESEVTPRPATISFIKQYARMCVPSLTDRLLNAPKMRRACLSAMASLCLIFTGCSSNDEPSAPSGLLVQGPGIMVLNEGGWGQNDARLDYLKFMTGEYFDGLYVKANPDVVKELGDVANDLQLHSGRLYAVVNGSHKVEIMDAHSIKRIGRVDISSPRAIAFSGDKAYVTSWVDGGNDNGSVVEFDINTLKITRTISVGQQPEGLAVSGGKLYVACSGDAIHYNYSDEMWVIDITRFSVEDKIHVAPNLHRCMADADGNIWVNSRGNYVDVSSGLYRITDGAVASANVPCAGFCIDGNTVYYYASEWNDAAYAFTMDYGTVDRLTLAKGASFITDGTESTIEAPYAIAATGGTVCITDAKNYATSGAIYVYTDGRRTYTHTTGICPASLVLLK